MPDVPLTAGDAGRCHIAYIALGSNLEQPVLQVRQAFEELEQLPFTQLLLRSALYRSEPLGRQDQPDFINAVVKIATGLAPHALLAALLAIEQHHGRMRESLNAPRTLDMDILLYDDLQYNDALLTVPHPRMHLRAFVLQPLQEIAPDCVIPGYGPVVDLLAICTGQRLQREPD